MPKFIEAKYQVKYVETNIGTTQMPPNTDYAAFLDHYKIDPKWLSDPEAYGVTLLDKNGAEVPKEKIFDESEGRTLYFFTEENEGPFALKIENNAAYITDEPLSFEDLVQLPDELKKKPVEPGTEAIPLEPDNAAKTAPEKPAEKVQPEAPEQEEQKAPEQKSEAPKQEEQKAPEQKSEVPKQEEQKAPEQKSEAPKQESEPKKSEPIPVRYEKFRGVEFGLDREAPEDVPEHLLPKAPEPLTGRQKLWDVVVMLFNGKGSERGQEYRRQMAKIQAVQDDYADWRKEFNEKVKESKLETTAEKKPEEKEQTVEVTKQNVQETVRQQEQPQAPEQQQKAPEQKSEAPKQQSEPKKSEPVPVRYEKFRGAEFALDREAPEDVPEHLLPKAPEPLTGRQKLWDVVVMLFNGKGSERGQEYRRQMTKIQAVQDDYAEWRKDFNQKVKGYKLETAAKKQAEEKEQTVEVTKQPVKQPVAQPVIQPQAPQQQGKPEPIVQEHTETPPTVKIDGIKTVTPDRAYEKYVVDLSKYHLGMRKVMKENPVAGMVDFKFNGLTMDNVITFTQSLADDIQKQKMDPKKLTDSQKDDLAKFLVFAQLDLDIHAELTANSKGYAKGASYDLRDVEERLQKLSTEKGLEEAVEQVKADRVFRTTVKECEAMEKTLTVNSVLSAYGSARQNQHRAIMTDKTKELKSQLKNHPDAKKTEELLVKMVMVNDASQRLEDKLKDNDGKVLSPTKQKQMANSLLKHVDVDYQKEFQRYEELNEKFGGEKYKSASPAERALYDETASHINAYNAVLKAHPKIAELSLHTGLVNDTLEKYELIAPRTNGEKTKANNQKTMAPDPLSQQPVSLGGAVL